MLWHQLSSEGRVWTLESAEIWGHGGSNWLFPLTPERARVPVKKIGSRDSILGLFNSTYFCKLTNHIQHAFNIKYLANFEHVSSIRNWQIHCCVSRPASARRSGGSQPSRKICSRIQLSFGFWGCAIKAHDNFSGKLACLSWTIVWKIYSKDLSPRFSKGEI